MLNITKHTESQDDDTLTKEDMLRIVEDNRSRIRVFSNVIVTVCSLVFSTSFLILFFVQEKLKGGFVTCLSALLIVINCVMIAAIVFAALTANSPPPTGIATKSSAILYQANLYRKEYRYSKISLILMFVGLFVFLVAMAFYVVMANI